jgi:hypothetical protein
MMTLSRAPHSIYLRNNEQRGSNQISCMSADLPEQRGNVISVREEQAAPDQDNQTCRTTDMGVAVFAQAEPSLQTKQRPPLKQRYGHW